MAVKMILTAPYGTHKYRKASSRRKKATVRFHLYDILRENESSERSISENSITDRESSTSNVYFMAYIAYRFNTFGQKENDNRYKTKIIKRRK